MEDKLSSANCMRIENHLKLPIPETGKSLLVYYFHTVNFWLAPRPSSHETHIF